MQRRMFVCSALGGMMSLSFPALGQPKGTRTIGFLHAASPEATQLARLAASHRMPAVYSVRDYVDVGGLMSYGPNITDMFYRVGAYAARVLAGRNPQDLPVEQINKLELVLNLACARDLGLEVPQSLRLRADDVVG